MQKIGHIAKNIFGKSPKPAGTVPPCYDVTTGTLREYDTPDTLVTSEDRLYSRRDIILSTVYICGK